MCPKCAENDMQMKYGSSKNKTPYFKLSYFFVGPCSGGTTLCEITFMYVIIWRSSDSLLLKSHLHPWTARNLPNSIRLTSARKTAPHSSTPPSPSSLSHGSSAGTLHESSAEWHVSTPPTPNPTQNPLLPPHHFYTPPVQDARHQ